MIDVATSLFVEHGFHATGVDTILKGSGISKKTLYKYFTSKEKFIIAVLDNYGNSFLKDFTEEITKDKNKNTKGQLLSIFDVAKKWFENDNFFGCIFINAIGEYSEKESEIRKICIKFKQSIQDFIMDLVTKLPILSTKKKKELANEIFILLEGATVITQISHNSKVVHSAKHAAKKLILYALK